MGQVTTSETKSQPYTAYVLIALLCGGSSIGIVQSIVSKFTQVTDSGFWAMAAMASSPALLGLGISYFVYRTSIADSGRDLD